MYKAGVRSPGEEGTRRNSHWTDKTPEPFNLALEPLLQTFGRPGCRCKVQPARLSTRCEIPKESHGRFRTADWGNSYVDGHHAHPGFGILRRVGSQAHEPGKVWCAATGAGFKGHVFTEAFNFLTRVVRKSLGLMRTNISKVGGAGIVKLPLFQLISWKTSRIPSSFPALHWRPWQPEACGNCRLSC